MTEAQSLEHLTEIAQWQLFDIIEVSGGDYENPGQSILLSANGHQFP
jgi:hypothetical protein